MRFRTLLQKIRHQIGRVLDQRDHLVVRHARRAYDAYDARERARVIRRRYDREAAEPGIGMFVADGDRQTAGLAARPQQIGEPLSRLRQRDELAHAVDAREFRLLREHRGLAEQYGLVARVETDIEHL